MASNIQTLIDFVPLVMKPCRQGSCWVVLVCACVSLMGHPMGNFSISHYSQLQVESKGVAIRYVLDFAEIPSFELFREWNLTGESSKAELERKALEQAKRWSLNLHTTTDGKPVSLVVRKVNVTVSPGAGNMPVLRVDMSLFGATAAGLLEYQDRNYTERAGWKEIVISADAGATVRSGSHGAQDRSRALLDYPQDAMIAPPQEVQAQLRWTANQTAIAPARTDAAKASPPEVHAVAPVAQPATERSETGSIASRSAEAAAGTVVRGDYLSRLLGTREITTGMAALGILVAFCLGALHALSPGHGKSIVAAYLVGSRGTPRHAAFLGAMVTFTHTVSVFALGFTIFFLSRYIAAEQVYPILGAMSGLSIVGVGGWLLFKRLRSLQKRSRSHRHHPHHHPHTHTQDHEHSHGPGGHSHVPEGDVSIGSLIALGASGGLVPCPSALVLLLSSFALGRIGYGLILLVGFSLGLAVVLTGIGLLVLFAKNLMPDRFSSRRHPAFRLVPVLSAAAILCIGLLMTGVSLGWVRPYSFS